MFDELLRDIARDASSLIFRAQPGPVQRRPVATREYKPNADVKPDAPTSAAAEAPVAAEKKIGRNDPCTCGSGKKYKKCCGRSAA
jgi:preprotein translocase subunit SecA